MSTYGFGGGIDLPKQSKARPTIDQNRIVRAVEAGRGLGFVSRESATRLKPGPKRTEPQDKVSIPGPKRVIDDFRSYCVARNITLWQGLEALLTEQND
jgi:hypothetical protein